MCQKTWWDSLISILSKHEKIDSPPPFPLQQTGKRQKNVNNNKGKGTNHKGENLHNTKKSIRSTKKKEKEKQTNLIDSFFYIINKSAKIVQTSIKKNVQIKTRTSAARPERDRRCDRGELALVAVVATAIAGPTSGRSGCSAHSSSVRKVDIRTWFDAGPTFEFTPALTIDHSTVLKRDVLAPSPKSNWSSLSSGQN